MTYTTVGLRIADGVAHITLNRPEAANAIDLTMARELFDAAIHCDAHGDVRAVVLTGAGRLFSAGGDVRAFAAAGERLPAVLKELTAHLHGAVSRLARMNAPVIAAVNGVAAGAGMSLACAPDIVLAAESARFTMAYTRLGFTPDGSSTFFLARLIGLRRAQELLFTNRMLTASEALAWNLVTRVVPDAELSAQAEQLARELAAGPTRAFGGVKRLLLAAASTGLETQMELETELIVDAARGADGREGPAAFVAKRPARFIGH
jgi:2-(1,2-epoxy-1,2-dihydrophenyl)acetyl-CoA isomerase